MQAGSFRLGRDGKDHPYLAVVPSPPFNWYLSRQPCGKKNLKRKGRQADNHRESYGKKISTRESFALENVEHTLADGDQTESGAGKKNRANKRLITQWRERTRLEVSDFCDELIERLPFRCDFPT